MDTRIFKFCIFFMLAGVILAENYADTEEIDEEPEATTSGWFSKGPLTTYRMSRARRPTPAMRMATFCTTPNNDTAYCMELKSCPKLYKQIAKPEAKNFLRASKCGPKNEDPTNPKVCCGKYGNFKHLVKHQVLPKRCGLQNVFFTGRIYGGREAQLGEFPWMARLIHRNKYGYTAFGCSGALIHPKYVLTAAHCLISDKIQIVGPLFEIELGEHNTDLEIDCKNTTKGEKCADKPQVIRVKQTITHPDFDPNSQHHLNDIGLVHLRKAAQLNEYVFPVCLGRELPMPKEYWVSGWGKTLNDTLSNIKMKVALPPFSTQECANKFGLIGMEIVGAEQICAGGVKNEDSCAGDSGGPLMMLKNRKWFAAGVVSYGWNCGSEGWPGVYTKTSHYLSWINQEIVKASTKTKRTIKK